MQLVEIDMPKSNEKQDGAVGPIDSKDLRMLNP